MGKWDHPSSPRPDLSPDHPRAGQPTSAGRWVVVKGSVAFIVRRQTRRRNVRPSAQKARNSGRVSAKRF